jgi:hypothetical protein
MRATANRSTSRPYTKIVCFISGSDPPLPTLPDFAKVAMTTPTKCEPDYKGIAISDDDELPDLDLLAAAGGQPPTKVDKPAAAISKGKGKAKGMRKSISPTELAYSEDSNFLPDLDDVTPSGSYDLPDLPDMIGSVADFDPVQCCGPLTGRTPTDKPRGTLIICPVSVISNWVEQFDDHLHENYHIALYTYYGQSRIRNPKILEKYDVVITTYSTLTSDNKSNSKINPLKRVNWFRLVLDEGHMIRNPSAQQTKAVLELKAERKWVLTGTPIQNSMKDFYSLVNFLQVSATIFLCLFLILLAFSPPLLPRSDLQHAPSAEEFLRKFTTKNSLRKKNPNRIMHVFFAHLHNHDLFDRNDNK